MTAKPPEQPPGSRPSTAWSSASSGVPMPTGTGATQTPASAAPPTPSAAPPPASAAKPAGTAKPPARPATRARRRSGYGWGSVAFVVSVLAVLIAIEATIISIYALNEARKAKSRMADSATGQPVAPPAGTNPAPSGAVSASPTRPPVVYSIDQSRVTLRIPPSTGCASTFVDIDNMQVGIDSGHELYLTTCFGAPTLWVDKAAGVVPAASGVTAEGCDAQLAAAPSSTQLAQQVRAGLAMCLLTDRNEAARQSIPQRLGIIEVREVGADGSVNLMVSTYRVPSSPPR